MARKPNTDLAVCLRHRGAHRTEEDAEREVERLFNKGIRVWAFPCAVGYPHFHTGHLNARGKQREQRGQA